MFFRCVKPCQNTVLSSKNKVSQGQCVGLENHQKTLKMTPKSIPILMKNRCENDARKSDAKITENGAKIEPKGEPKSRKICKKCMQKTMPKIDPKKGHTTDPRRRSGGVHFNTF